MVFPAHLVLKVVGLLYVVDDKVANTFAPRCNKNFVGREISIGKWPTVFPVDPTYVLKGGCRGLPLLPMQHPEMADINIQG